ncbi:hypothetical protein OGAPHI_006226 [Ogataea philodendri]|uniref:Uncharacterized protein n=1 Tax=Ogataea philodendri TaxID=1378263 RepID=A0A9P8T1K9_9ASCO|nr:uncharacterized protein OGAPHI_006226 [Ogataea philodendri]KAH3662045.1 hypothetical protein OGAPHI_006226 [Ogataea philodendri]
MDSDLEFNRKIRIGRSLSDEILASGYKVYLRAAKLLRPSTETGPFGFKKYGEYWCKMDAMVAGKLNILVTTASWNSVSIE